MIKDFFSGMKGIYIVLSLFFLWLVISAFWYTCGIKGFCGEKEAISSLNQRQTESLYNESKTFGERKESQRDLFRGGENKSKEFVLECDTYLKSYIVYGADNPASEVLKLQKFLNEHEGENLRLDAFYGIDDKKAVEKFQKKYGEYILEPLGMKEASGKVLEYTKDYINALYCADEFIKSKN